MLIETGSGTHWLPSVWLLSALPCQRVTHCCQTPPLWRYWVVRISPVPTFPLPPSPVPSVKNTDFKEFLPLKSGIGQCIAIYATLTARNFFIANFYPSGLFICIFQKTKTKNKNSPEVFLLAVANTGSCIGLRNKIGHPARCRFPRWVPVLLFFWVCLPKLWIESELWFEKKRLVV